MNIRDFTVVKFHGPTGAELWRRAISSTAGFGTANAVRVDGFGNVVAAGYTDNIGTDRDFTVVKLNGIDGTDF